MILSELKREVQEYAPALIIDRLFPERTRFAVLKILGGIVALCGFLMLLSTLYSSLTMGCGMPGDILASAYCSLAGIDWMSHVFILSYFTFLIITPLFLITLLLSFYRNSYFYTGYETIFKEKFHDHSGAFLSFESAEVIDVMLRHSSGDALRGFLDSEYGREIMLRSEVKGDEIRGFAKKRSLVLAPEDLDLEKTEDSPIRLSGIARALLEHDNEFKDFLFEHSITPDLFVSSASWLQSRIFSKKQQSRWWGRDRLSRVAGLGKDWSYARAYNLEKFGIYAYESPLYGSASAGSSIHRKEIDMIESIFARARQANALVIGVDGSQLESIALQLAKEIEEGRAVPHIEGKKMFLLDGEAVVSSAHDKNSFERLLIRILNEAVRARNLILVTKNFPGFLRSAQAIGSDVASLIEPYLASSGIRFIALSDLESFYQDIEPRSLLMQHFDVVRSRENDRKGMISILEDESERLEERHGIMVSYPAIVAVLESARRYITEGVMPDKALDLLEAVVLQSIRRGHALVTKDEVKSAVETTTGIPAGEVKEEEREKLLNLEKILHTHVVDQEEAIKAIGRTMRRARTDVRDPLRPMGSFLFLGPTGVGKTETAKALAHVFFGNEDALVRFDMSEYSGDNALEKLIGSFQSGKPGLLSVRLKEHPYSLLLLDEFEKTDREVMNLFLQVLDEGMFSDMDGQEINVRNSIIIATSNAGSDRIWDYAKKGENPAFHYDEIVDSLIEEHSFKPELLNRFDSTVIFRPLTPDHVLKVAHLLLNDLVDRLKEKGIKLNVTDELATFVAHEGYDPKFGARPMNRVIQDVIEEAIARKMIEGSIREGDSVELSRADLKV